MATVRRADAPDSIVLVTQFRPPTNRTCLELPAGLVDRGETVEEAALRELKEETGYEGQVEEVTPVLFGDPGMSNANLRLVYISVDGNAGCNRRPIPEPEEGEEIDVLLAPSGAALRGHIDMLCRDRNLAADARLYSFACGLAQRISSGEGEAITKPVPSRASHGEEELQVNQQALVWVTAALCLIGAVVAAVVRNF